ncbi:hypothetical protein SPHINGOT1_260231 [Sphingomonas sp. T1]|nr:hypothetical protein SPHINGOT1_260231 [Sphingomonas sp. T1]
MTLRRGGRVVERTALEMRRTREGTVGSNPTLSAIYLAPCGSKRSLAPAPGPRTSL